LLGHHEKRGGNHLVFKTDAITNVKLFHGYCEFTAISLLRVNQTQ
jgi:hypothetical protein